MKIVFITYHNWETKRHGGFHQFAKYAAQSGNEVVFFSFARPYYIALMNDERLNRKVLIKLSKGVIYDIGDNYIANITWPTLGLPGFLCKYVPYGINKWLMTHSLNPFNRFSKKWLTGTDCFVFESTDAVLLAKDIQKRFPRATIVYRPSDPLWEFSHSFYHIKGEQEMLEIADKIILVNDQSGIGYQKMFGSVFNLSKATVIPNGVDLKEFTSRHPVPQLLNYPVTACYIGVLEPDYELMINTAIALKYIRFILITPHKIDNKLRKRIDSIDNLFFIPGIPPSDVSSWITNCSIVIQPLSGSNNHADKFSLGLTAQNYKAMAAGKPIVAYHIPPHLSKYGIKIAKTDEEFIGMIQDSVYERKQEYNIDLEALDWDKLCANFLECVLSK